MANPTPPASNSNTPIRTSKTDTSSAPSHQPFHPSQSPFRLSATAPSAQSGSDPSIDGQPNPALGQSGMMLPPTSNTASGTLGAQADFQAEQDEQAGSMLGLSNMLNGERGLNPEEEEEEREEMTEGSDDEPLTARDAEGGRPIGDREDEFDEEDVLEEEEEMVEHKPDEGVEAQGDVRGEVNEGMDIDQAAQPQMQLEASGADQDDKTASKKAKTSASSRSSRTSKQPKTDEKPTSKSKSAQLPATPSSKALNASTSSAGGISESTSKTPRKGYNKKDGGDMWEGEIVARWHLEIGDICVDPSLPPPTPAAAKA